MKARPRRSIDRARQFVTAFVNERKLRPGDEVPPARQLADAAGVSFLTMLRALNELKRHNALTGSAGHPFRVAAPNRTPAETATHARADTHSSAPAVQSTVWRRTREGITHDILSGALAPGSDLPSAKELQGRYGASWPPLKKALDSLLSAGIVQRRGRRVFIPAFATQGYRSRIVLLTHSFDSFTMYLGQHDEELLKTLERECAHAHIALDVYLVFPELPRTDPDRQLLRERRTGRELPLESVVELDDPIVLGYIFVVPGGLWGTEERILPALKLSRKPTAVLAEAGGWSLPPEYARTGLMRLFTIASSTEPAREVARYLSSSGHRRIAFISPYHQYPWSQKRLEGLLEALLPAEPVARVFAYTAECDPRVAHAPAEIVEFFQSRTTGLPREQTMEYSALLERIREEVAPQIRMREVLYGLLDRALADAPGKEITAWVLVNDRNACLAIEYLSSRGVSVPRDLSIVSFDDSRDALRMNLTSYNFNASGVAVAMLGFVLNRRPFADAGKTGVPEIEGYIAKRQTVAQLRGREPGSG